MEVDHQVEVADLLVTPLGPIQLLLCRLPHLWGGGEVRMEDHRKRRVNPTWT